MREGGRRSPVPSLIHTHSRAHTGCQFVAPHTLTLTHTQLSPVTNERQDRAYVSERRENAAASTGRSEREIKGGKGKGRQLLRHIFSLSPSHSLPNGDREAEVRQLGWQQQHPAPSFASPAASSSPACMVAGCGSSSGSKNERMSNGCSDAR